MPNRAAIINALLIGQPMCIRCLAVKSELTPADLDATIGTVKMSLALHLVIDRCEVCGMIDAVFSLGRPVCK